MQFVYICDYCVFEEDLYHILSFQLLNNIKDGHHKIYLVLSVFN